MIRVIVADPFADVLAFGMWGLGWFAVGLLVMWCWLTYGPRDSDS